MNLYIKVGSITNAQRGQKLLRKHGYKPQIKRTENPSQTDGCGYVIRVAANGDEPIEILEKNGIEVRGAQRK